MRVDLIDTTSDYIPLSLFYLKSYAETDPVIGRDGRIEVVVPDDVPDAEATAAEIVARKPDVVGFSCYVWNMGQTMKICRLIKEKSPKTTIVVGGPDVSSVPEKALRGNPWVDVIVRGEGEETFRELLRHWMDHDGPSVGPELRAIQGLGFRHGEEIVLTDRRPFIEDLDIIPSPYLNGAIDLKSEKRIILFETYRGCPFKCSFCFYPKDYGKLLHSFSPDRVRHDLEEILKSGVKSIFLMDPTFNIPPKRQKQIIKVLADNRQSDDMSVTVELRVDLLDREFMDLLKDAGIGIVEIGLQSVNEDALQAVARKQNMRKITENVAYLQSIGIDVVFQLIYGLPEDDYDWFLKTLDFCVARNASKIEAYRLQLLPGTPMYQSADLLGLEFVDEGERKIVRTRTMTEADIDDAESLARLFQVFYDSKVARDAFRWLARHLEISYAQLLDRYMRWRLSLDVPLESWLAEGNRRVGDFVRSLGLKNGDAVMDVVENLLRYDHHTSPIIEVMRNVLSHFDYDVATAVADETGTLPERRDSWILFATTDRVNVNLFNGRVFRKSFRPLTHDIVFAHDLAGDASMSDADVMAVATWHMGQGDFERAAKLAQDVLARSPEQAEAMHVLGQIAAERGDAGKALDYLERAVAAAPAAAHCHVTLGNVRAALGEWPAAIAAFENAVRHDPELVEPYFNLGMGYAEGGKLDAAIAAFLRVTELEPDMAMGYFSLGECLRMTDRNEDAVMAYERALELDPALDDARQGLTEVRAAMRSSSAAE